METVIAIGVLAVLLTAFMAVFGPAGRGIRRTINAQEADRLTSALEQELATNRIKGGANEDLTAFHKAYRWIESSHKPDNIVFAYQYKGDPAQIREDGSLKPYLGKSGQAGKDYVVQPAFRLRNDTLLADDMQALQGRVFFVKMTQLIVDGTNGLKLGTPGSIISPPVTNGSQTPLTGAGADGYNDAVIPFVADFYEVQTTDKNYLKSGGGLNPDKFKSPVFSRNLAVRR